MRLKLVLGMLQNLETSNNKTRNANIYIKYIVFIRLNSFELNWLI